MIKETLTAVLSIALLTTPQFLLSQSNEQSAETSKYNVMFHRTPDGRVENIGLTQGMDRLVVDAGLFSGLTGTSSELAFLSGFADKSATGLDQLFSQLREQYSDNPDAELLIEISQQSGEVVTNVTLSGQNTFQVSGGNPVVHKLYEFMGVSSQSAFSSDVRVTVPVLIHKVEPIYPETAKESGLSGDVILRVSTDAKGETTWVSLDDGHPELARAAIAAVSQWRYEPALSSDGKPVSTTFFTLIRFLPDGTIDFEQGRGIIISEH